MVVLSWERKSLYLEITRCPTKQQKHCKNDTYSGRRGRDPFRSVIGCLCFVGTTHTGSLCDLATTYTLGLAFPTSSDTVCHTVRLLIVTR